jgi:hypothetical protein
MLQAATSSRPGQACYAVHVIHLTQQACYLQELPHVCQINDVYPSLDARYYNLQLALFKLGP